MKANNIIYLNKRHKVLKISILQKKLQLKNPHYLGKYPKLFKSDISELLKVKIVDGKKILNTRNTNYSYGMLEEVLNFGLEQIPLKKVHKTLVLGMGAGCVIHSLRDKFNYHAFIKAVEIDPVVIEIAERKFNISPSDKLQIVKEDAVKYIQITQKKFDLIIVDIFIDLKVPQKIYSKDFWQDLENKLKINGYILFNAGIDMTDQAIDHFLDNLSDNFVYQINYDVYESNTVIILHKIGA